MLLAVREITRAKTRFALLTGAIGLLVFLILFQQGLLGGLVTDFIGAVDNQRSPVLVFNEQARRYVEASFMTPEQAGDAIKGRPTLKAKTPRNDDYGEVRGHVTLTNQRDEAVAEYELLTLNA
mgnify:CR=1 FL=1